VNLSDAILLEGLRKGDRDAFSTLFLRHHQAVYRFLLKLTGSASEAEDLAQEVFIRLYRHPLDGNREHNVLAWLYRVAVNLVYNSHRAKTREDQRYDRAGRLAETDGGAEESQDPADQVLREERRRQVDRVIGSLPPRQQQCLILRYEGFSYAEIAAALGVAPGSVGTLLARAEAEFARRYKESERGEVT
jgi:RNA polymerase sigma-70 factor, ECF subfamily